MKILELLTDAKNRPEIKAVLGLLAIAVSFVWLFLKSDVPGFLAIFGSGAVLLGIQAVADAKIDGK